MSKDENDLVVLQYGDMTLENIKTGVCRNITPGMVKILIPLIDWYPLITSYEVIRNYSGLTDSIQGDAVINSNIFKLRRIFEDLSFPEIISLERNIGYRLLSPIATKTHKHIIPSTHVRVLKDLLESHPDQITAGELKRIVYGNAT